ncbi:MAG: hypothetical protein ABSC42_09775 [Tepidisphaeraceae bacterium]|jgi:hypothetical protein
MAEWTTGDSRGIEPLGYASAGLYRQHPLVTAVGIVSICVGSLGLLFDCVSEHSAVGELRAANQATAQMQQLAVRRAQSLAAGMKAAASQPTAFRALTPAENSATIDYINKELDSRNHDSLDEAQRNALVKMLSKDGQGLIDPDVPLGSQTPGRLQMVRAWASGNHSVLLAANHGSPYNIYRTRLDAAGNQTAYPTIGLSNFSSNPIPPPMTITPQQNQQILHDQYISAMLSAIIFGINAILAIILLAAGVDLLKSNPRGIRLHWAYAAIKLPLSIAVGTSVLTTYFATQMPLEFPLGTPLALVGCLYPISLLIVLPSGTFRSPAHNSAAVSQSFGFGESRPSLFTAIGMISICVGCINLLVGGFYEIGAFGEMSRANYDRAVEEQQLRWQDLKLSPYRAQMYDREYQSAEFAAIVFPLDLVPGLLLLIGAYQILKSKPRGIMTHRVYAVLKLITATLGAIAVFASFEIEGPILVLPSILAVIYPVALLIALRHENPRMEIRGLSAVN